MTPHPSQSGNVLFYILLCIALFAALGYAFSRGSTGGAQAISDEKAKLYASEIINYANQLQSAMVKLKLRGCSDTTFDFSNSIYLTVAGSATNTGNTNSPSDDSCDLFSSSGGNITPYIPPSEAVTSGVSSPTTNWLPGHGGIRVGQFLKVGTDDAAGTTSANDIYFNINYLQLKVCSAINTLLGINPIITVSGTQGTYINGSLSSTLILDSKAPGALIFCNPLTNYGHLNVVLVKR